MNKTEKRKFMKALCIAREVADYQSRRLRMLTDNRWGFALMPKYSGQAARIAQTPSHLFRHDNPKLDKRRLKRFNKIHKNSYIVGPNTDQPVDVDKLFDKFCNININNNQSK